MSESEPRPVLGPTGNKARSVVEPRKAVAKPKFSISVAEKVDEIDDLVKGKNSPAPAEAALSPPSVMNCTVTILRQQEARSVLMRSNLSMNASCSSDASSDSSRSRASTGRIGRRSITPIKRKQQQCGLKFERIEKYERNVEKSVGDVQSIAVSLGDGSMAKRRCAWVTAHTERFFETLTQLQSQN